jgi:predicted nucleotidyltransferase
MKAEKFGLRESDLKEITQVLQKFDTIYEAILFGSRAKGNFFHGSDVDIAIVGDFDFKDFIHLRYLLNEESMMPYSFDVVVYKDIQNQKLKEHIDRVGICIYECSKVLS